MGCGVSLIRKEESTDDAIQFDDAVRTELLSQYDTFRFGALNPLCISRDDSNMYQFSSQSPTTDAPESGQVGADDNYQTEHWRETDFDIVENARTLVEDIQRLLWRVADPINHGQQLSIHNDLHYDVCLMLIMGDGIKYIAYAHAAILATRSSYFASQLSSMLMSGIRMNGSLGISNDNTKTNNLFERMIDLELELPRIVQDVHSFIIVLEFVYTGYFEPSFVKRFSEWSDESNLTRLIEILALAHEYQLKSLQKICQYHISRIVNAHVRELSDFTTFIETLCPNLSLNALQMSVKVKIDVEGAFKDSYSMCIFFLF
jgi:hypothetical protein